MRHDLHPETTVLSLKRRWNHESTTARDRAAVHRIAWRDRRMAESRTYQFKSELPDEELLHNVLTAIYAPGRRTAPGEILAPAPPSEVAGMRSSAPRAPAARREAGGRRRENGRAPGGVPSAARPRAPIAARR